MMLLFLKVFGKKQQSMKNFFQSNSGVSNSNILEGHISLKNNAPRGAVYWKKAFAGHILQEKSS
jgi:hypothetical protein